MKSIIFEKLKIFAPFNNCKHNDILIRCTTIAKSIIYLKNSIFAMQPHWSVQVLVPQIQAL